MTILSAMQKAALRIYGQRPQVFFTSQRQFEQELVDLVNEVAEDVLQYQDWQALTKIGQVTGDGSTYAFPLPDDYSRMLIKSDMQDANSWAWGYCHITDINEFLFRKAHGFNPWPGGWIIAENHFSFSPAPSGIATYPYISKNYAIGADGVRKSEFTADDDSFALPERLLTLGLVWRWRENKKLDASGDQEAFIKALDEYGAKDIGSRIYRTGNRLRGNFSMAYPGAAVGW